MSAIHQYISAVGSFQGVLLFFLLMCDQKTTAASKVLGLYCLCMGVAFFLPFISFGVTHEAFYPLAAWVFFLPVMYGPLLYLYCNKVVFNSPFKLRDLAHALPLIACYGMNLDVLLIEHEALRLWIVGAQAPTSRLWFSEYILFGVAMAYLLATVWLIRRYHKQASDTLSNFNPAVFRWLSVLISSFIVIFLFKGVMAFTNFATLLMIILSDAMIVFIILIIALRQWKTPRFFEVSHQPNQSCADTKTSTVIKSDVGAIDHDTRAVMFEELVRHIEQNYDYRDSGLTLTKLADACGLTTHHLSEVMNQYAGKNFNQFINEYRVKEVCENLDNCDDIPVLDIAMRAGFSSKTTFNTMFKKIMGITPTQYRQQHSLP